VQVHADGIFDHLRRARLGVGRLLVLGFLPLRHVLFAQHLHAERLQDLQVAVGLDGVDDVLREDLVQLLVGDVAAVRLAAALHLVDDVVELGLAQDRHALHRRQHHVDVVRGVVAHVEAR